MEFFARFYFTEKNFISSIFIFSNLTGPHFLKDVSSSHHALSHRLRLCLMLDKSKSTGNQEKCSTWYSIKWKCIRIISSSAIPNYRVIQHNRNNCSSFWENSNKLHGLYIKDFIFTQRSCILQGVLFCRRLLF